MMDYYQHFAETLYKTRPPCAEEMFVIEKLREVKGLISYTQTLILDNGEANIYLKSVILFLSTLRLELEKLYLMNITYCSNHSLSKKELSDLHREIEGFLEIQCKLHEKMSENEMLYRKLYTSKPYIAGKIGNFDFELTTAHIYRLHQEELRAFVTFATYLSLCTKILDDALYEYEHPMILYSSFEISGHSHMYLKNSTYEKSFQSLLFSIIDEKKVSDSQVYNKARVSRQVFSNIRKDANYIPKKVTVISLCIALELDISKTTQLLSSCGYALSEYIMYDKIITYCITQSCYDIDKINVILTDFHLTPIGCCSH